MKDLDIMEFLLQHSQFEPQLQVSNRKIAVHFKEEIKKLPGAMRKTTKKISKKFNRCIARIDDQIFIDRQMQIVK